MAIKIQISGGSNELLQEIITKALRNAGVSVSAWSRCKPKDIPRCMRETTRAKHLVAVIAMNDGR